MILQGDCLKQLKQLESNSIDALLTDPPYGLSQISMDDTHQCLSAWLSGQNYEHSKSGFMGKKWDSFVPSPDVWKEVYRVLKHGAHGVVFAGTRTQDLMSISLRLAGFEVRDTLMYLYGSGFPKSHNVSLAIDKKLGHPNRGKAIPTASQYQASDVEEKNKLTSNPVPEYTAKTTEAQDYSGQGTALKPAYEPIILIRKPLQGTIADNVLQHGTGGLNIDDCRIRYDDGEDIDFSKMHEQKTASYEQSGWRGHIAKVGSKIQTYKPKGRFPANVLLDEESALALDQQSGIQKSGRAGKNSRAWGVAGKGQLSSTEDGVGWKAYGSEGYRDIGGASRFFYTSKASKKEREAGLDGLKKDTSTEITNRKERSAGLVMKRPNGNDKPNPYAGTSGQQPRANIHPTVKPLDLIEYLLKLITPKKGTVLDPYGGSGTTACAAIRNGRKYVICELDERYIEIIRAKVQHYEQEINNSLFRPEDF